MADNLTPGVYGEAGSSTSTMTVRPSCMRVHRSPSTKDYLGDYMTDLKPPKRSSPAKQECAPGKTVLQGKGKNRPVSWHESVPQLSLSSSAEIETLTDSDRNLYRQQSRRGSRRVRRCESAREGADPVKVRAKVRRSISERGSVDGDPRSRHHHHHKNRPQRQGSKRQKSRAQSVQSSLSGIDVSSLCSRTSEKSRQQSLTEAVAVELGLAETPGVSPKESKRRRIVFAVVLISLVLLTTCVFLVAITLLLSPAVDAVIRKENEEILRVLVTPASNQRPEQNHTLPTTTATTTGHPG